MFNSFDVQHIIQIYIIYHVFFHWINAYKSLIIIIWRTTERPFRGNVNQKNSRNVFDRLWYPLSILLLAAIGAKLIGPHGGLQVDKNDVKLRNWLDGMAEKFLYIYCLKKYML